MSLYHELKRRNVFRVAIAYLAGSWLLIEVAGTIFPLFGFHDTPTRILVIVLAIGFPLFLLFSWVFEITPEGLKKEKDIDRTASVTHKTGKQLDRIIIVLLALALGYFAFDKFVLDPVEDDQIAESAHQEGRSEALTESFGDKSIAVLPFVNMSADPEQEYFSDGISEELLNLLSKIPELRVISRSSSFSFKGKDLDIPTIAKQLNVAHILEGSVRKDGNQVRITAQLIEARSDTHLWSQTYDRELANIFVVQDEISAAITGALKERLGLQLDAAPMEAAVSNAEAHDAYLRGRYLVIQRTSDSIEGAIREFENAIVLDPNYALAHAELAMAILLSRSYSGSLSAGEAIARAIPYTERATALDPNLAESQAATGFLLWHQLKPQEALFHYRRALQINPNYSSVYSRMDNLLNTLGRYEEAFSMVETALRLDPLSKKAINNYAIGLINRNRLEDAGKELEKLVSIAPAWYHSAKGDLDNVGGQWSNLVLGTLKALQIAPERVAYRDHLSVQFAVIGLEKEALAVSEKIHPDVLNILGRPEEAITIAEEDLAANPDFVAARFQLGMVSAAMGDYDNAGPILEEMWQRSLELVTGWGMFNVDHAAALIAIRRDSGDDAGVEEILAAISDNVRRYREAGMIRAFWLYSADYEEGLTAFLRGERDRGLALIAKGMEDGYFISSRKAYLQPLYDDPNFALILTGQEERQTRERNHFLSIVCTDNPYADVWQPAEGTCESYAAEGGN